jgi:hypothetical protein
MSVKDWVESLGRLGSHAGPGLVGEAGAESALPASHLALLRMVNGVTVYHGMFRLLGVNRDDSCLDMGSWNASESWRFAWDERLDPYWIFGETAWGDQYAYWQEEDGTWGSRVFLLEANFMRPEVLEESFEEFIENDFLRNARDPYDSFVPEVVRRYGSISPADHWVYVPSLALGGVEDLDNVMKMPCNIAMIFAGDMAIAVRDSREEERASEVTPWVDDRGRQRLKVSFLSE